jgi:hypothetical protein
MPAPAVARRAEFPDRAARPVRPSNREEVAAEQDGSCLLLFPARDRDDHSVGAVGHRVPGVVEPIPDLCPVRPGLDRAQLDPPNLAATARDLDRHVGRPSRNPELDPDAIGGVGEAAGGGDGGTLNNRAFGGHRLGCGEERRGPEQDRCESPQRCSITRSTILYSFASSALMK